MHNKKLAALTFAGVFALTGCSTSQQQLPEATHEHAAPVIANAKEVPSLSRYAVLAHKDGLQTVNLHNGDTVANTQLSGVTELTPTGDNRHLLVTTDNAFKVYDSGLLAVAHGDHFHYYEQKPALTQATYLAKQPGKAMLNHGKAALFANGSGKVQILKSKDLPLKQAKVTELELEDPHPGFAVVLKNHAILSTNSGDTLQVVKNGKTVAKTTKCRDPRTAAVAKPDSQGDVIVIGCANGAVVYKNGKFQKLNIAGSAAPITALAASAKSAVVLASYSPSDELDILSQAVLINTETLTTRLVTLPVGYLPQSLARGANGKSLLLTADGNLVAIDTAAGKVTSQLQVFTPLPETGLQGLPAPLLRIQGSWAYIADPASDTLTVVDLTSNEVTKQLPLQVEATAMEIVTGK